MLGAGPTQEEQAVRNTFQKRLVFVLTEDPEVQWATTAQWNVHQQAVIPQRWLEQESHLQSTPAPSPHEWGALFYTDHIKNQTSPEMRNLS